jgi:hypothetical protein
MSCLVITFFFADLQRHDGEKALSEHSVDADGCSRTIERVDKCR